MSKTFRACGDLISLPKKCLFLSEIHKSIICRAENTTGKAVGTFHPENFHHNDISLRRHFTPRTFHPRDISPNGHSTPLFERRIQWVKLNKKKEQLLRNWCVSDRTNSIKGLDLKAAPHFLNAFWLTTINKSWTLRHHRKILLICQSQIVTF